MFSADPRLVPSARLLRRLNYYEAQEITTTGSQVVHPRAIRALRGWGIPIHLKSTLDPGSPNTVIEPTETEGPARVKAISWKGKVVLVSMETLGMWHEVGFLARAFAVFKEQGVSIDLVSTSESNVTVSLDSKATLLDEEKLAAVQEGLARFCRVQIIRPCAAVSLVGGRIRDLLHRMGPVMEAFAGHRIHLVSQAASDLNFTVVVDEDGANRLVRRVHEILIPATGTTDVFGPSWEELTEVTAGG
jgi:diaminopimelate decarboxylase/aspartate kinase